MPESSSQADGADLSNRASSEDVERPRSALHSGNFTESSDGLQDSPRDRYFQETRPLAGPSGSLPTAPWHSPAHSSSNDFKVDAQFLPAQHAPTKPERGPLRSRAPSLQSFSSSYVFKAPTSPLVQQSNNTDLDFAPIDISTSPGKSNRRHTLPPQILHSMRTSPNGNLPMLSQASRTPPSTRHERCFPFQTHHARRSLTSAWFLQTTTSPQTPALPRSRGTSVSSESYPLQHASMVGSYEESILRGRMSTGPSKPLDFTAQIGALGKGNAKPKYPAHVTIHFPAVFYNWSGGTGRSQSIFDDEPSPYVGLVDLEHSLPPSQSNGCRRKQKGMFASEDCDALGGVEDSHEDSDVLANTEFKKQEKRKRRSTSPKAPPGGSYRIPQEGQLQIMIKNPNKTAVKLFLVPYDLSNMEVGTKTFIRQKCYSVGPVLDNPPTLKATLDLVDRSLMAKVDTKNKQTLRYLIHLNICCPSKGRFFLHQHMRVVFANRVPDNKENLQTQIQLPEPRYSIYKPHREPISGLRASTGANLKEESMIRRRSYGYGAAYSQGIDDSLNGLQSQPFAGGSTFTFNYSTPAPPVPAIPFSLARPGNQPVMHIHSMSRAENDGIQDDRMEMDISSRPTSSGLQSPLSDKTSRIANTLSSSHKSNSSHSSDDYIKLNKGDAGYGGLFGRSATPEPGEGLLARRLRGLGVQKETNRSDFSS